MNPNETTKTEQPTSAAPPIADRFNLEPIPGPTHTGAVLASLLKAPGQVLHEAASGRTSSVFRGLMLITFVCLSIYGCVAGSLSGGAQMWIAPAKILVGSALSALICLPSLYIFLCLSGADTHVRSVAAELAASVALMSLLLLGFAPVAWVFSQSTDSVALMATLHIAFWMISMGFGLTLIGRTCGSGGNRAKVWRVIYVVVCLQMITCLRPIIGSSDTLLPKEKMFFLAHAWEVLVNPPVR